MLIPEVINKSATSTLIEKASFNTKAFFNCLTLLVKTNATKGRKIQNIIFLLLIE